MKKEPNYVKIARCIAYFLCIAMLGATFFVEKKYPLVVISLFMFLFGYFVFVKNAVEKMKTHSFLLVILEYAMVFLLFLQNNIDSNSSNVFVAAFTIVTFYIVTLGIIISVYLKNKVNNAKRIVSLVYEIKETNSKERKAKLTELINQNFVSKPKSISLLEEKIKDEKDEGKIENMLDNLTFFNIYIINLYTTPVVNSFFYLFLTICAEFIMRLELFYTLKTDKNFGKQPIFNNDEYNREMNKLNFNYRFEKIFKK